MTVAGRVYVQPDNLSTIYLNLILFWQDVTAVTSKPCAII